MDPLLEDILGLCEEIEKRVSLPSDLSLRLVEILSTLRDLEEVSNYEGDDE